MNHHEYDLQKSICKYLDLQYPQVLYMSDTIASCKLTMQQATRNKAIQKDGFNCPDLIIFKPKENAVGQVMYSGLFIELKIESPYLKDGLNLKSDKHIQGQAQTMNKLYAEGYSCHFAWSFDQAKKIIDNYLKNDW